MSDKVESVTHGDAPTRPSVGTMDRPIARPGKAVLARRIGLWGGAGLALVGAVVLLAPGSGRSLRLSGERIVISKVVRGTFEDVIPVRARVTPLKTLYLDAVEGGRIDRVLVEDGAMVKAGQLLIELSNTALQLDVISREAQVTEQLNNLRNLELALERNRLEHKRNLIEIDYQLTRLGHLLERRRTLAARGNLAQADLQDTEDEYAYYQRRRAVTVESQKTDEAIQKAQLKQLRTAADQLTRNLAFARRNLESLEVRAPVSGKLTALNAEVGQSLKPGDRLGQIDDPSGFKLRARIDEFYLGRVAIGQSAELTRAGRRYGLEIAKIYPQVRDGQFDVDLLFVDRTPPKIRRGQTLQLRLSLGDASTALLIPNGAFYQDTGGNWVFVVNTEGTRAVRRTVKLGRRNARVIEVLDGLDEGERVITSPYTNFLDMERLELGT